MGDGLNRDSLTLAKAVSFSQKNLVRPTIQRRKKNYSVHQSLEQQDVVGCDIPDVYKHPSQSG